MTGLAAKDPSNRMAVFWLFSSLYTGAFGLAGAGLIYLIVVSWLKP